MVFYLVFSAVLVISMNLTAAAGQLLRGPLMEVDVSDYGDISEMRLMTCPKVIRHPSVECSTVIRFAHREPWLTRAEN